MQQGEHSTIKEFDDRIQKLIKEIDAYGNDVNPYQEYETLSKVSKLGNMFPQNVKCEGPLSLSYDKIHGITLQQYLNLTWEKDHNYPSVEIQRNILSQILTAYEKMYNLGFVHGDSNLKNFLINEEGKIYVIDFGFTYSRIENPITFQEVMFKLYESFYYGEFISEEVYESLSQ